jgi:hypothetical protein
MVIKPSCIAGSNPAPRHYVPPCSKAGELVSKTDCGGSDSYGVRLLAMTAAMLLALRVTTRLSKYHKFVLRLGHTPVVRRPEQEGNESSNLPLVEY